MQASSGLRMQAVPQPSSLYMAANLLLQKFPAPEFSAETVVDTTDLRSGERAGLIVFGEDYAWLGIERLGAQRSLVLRAAEQAQEGRPEAVAFSEPWSGAQVTLRLRVAAGAHYRFAVGEGDKVRDVGPTFQAKPGRWVGAKVGLFAAARTDAAETGSASFARFTVSAVR